MGVWGFGGVVLLNKEVVGGDLGISGLVWLYFFSFLLEYRIIFLVGWLCIIFMLYCGFFFVLTVFIQLKVLLGMFFRNLVLYFLSIFNDWAMLFLVLLSKRLVVK